jgi:capsular exopolysaccharide synthesis family protein
MLNKAAWLTSTRARDPQAADPKEPIIDLVEAFRLVRRRGVWIASILVLAISGGVIYLATTPTRYTASSTLLFDIRTIQPFQQQSYVQSATDSAHVDSQLEILKSESIAISVIRNLNLLSDPEFISQTSGLLGTIRRIFNAVLEARKVSTESDQWGRAVAVFQANLEIKRVGSTHVIQVGYRSLDASKAARVSNAVTDAYLANQLESKYRAAHYADIWLQDRIDKLKTQAQNADRAVAEYKAKNNVVDTGAPLLNEQQLTDLSNQRRVILKDLESSAQTYRTLYETFLQRVAEVTQQQSFPANEVRVISEASPSLVKSDPKALRVLGAASLLGLVCGFGAAFAREYLDRSFCSSGQFEKEVGIECLGILPTIRPAHRRDWHNPRQQTHTAGCDRVISPSIGRHRFVVGEPFSRFAETIRSLKVAADIAGLQRPNKVIGVTSARPYEGKSLVAANLSEMIAISGCKALLIDGDLRKVALTEQFAPKAKGGLMEVIAGQAAVADLVWRDPITDLDFLPALKHPIGRDPITNRELSPAVLCQRTQLTPMGLKKLLESVQDRYDYVILDLPPITPVADVKATSHLLDSFILVVEWGRTSQQAVIDALNAAPFVFEKLLGAVLNKADPTELKRMES